MNYILLKSPVHHEIYLLQGDITSWLENLHASFWLEEAQLYSLQPENQQNELLKGKIPVPSMQLRWEQTIGPDAPLEQHIQASIDAARKLSPEVQMAEIERLIGKLKQVLPTGT